MELVPPLGRPSTVAIPSDLGVVPTIDPTNTTQPEKQSYGFDSDYLTAYNPEYTHDYSRADAVKAGFETTMIKSVYDAYNAPVFETQPGFLGHEETARLEKAYGYEFNPEQREYLNEAVSTEDYSWRQNELAARQEEGTRGANHPVFYMTGMLADADLALGFGLGKLASLGKLSRGARMATTGGIIGGIEGAGMVYAQSRLPIPTSEVILMTVGTGIGGMFVGVKGAPKLAMPEGLDPAYISTHLLPNRVPPKVPSNIMQHNAGSIDDAITVSTNLPKYAKVDGLAPLINLEDGTKETLYKTEAAGNFPQVNKGDGWYLDITKTHTNVPATMDLYLGKTLRLADIKTPELLEQLAPYRKELTPTTNYAANLKVNTSLQQTLVGGNINDLISKLGELSPSSAYTQTLNAVKTKIEAMVVDGAEVQIVEHTARDGTLGTVRSYGNKFDLSLSVKDANLQTSLHELVHVATMGNLAKNPILRADMEKLHSVIVAEGAKLKNGLNSFRVPTFTADVEAFLEKASLGSNNSLNNIDELMAWGLTNSDMQAWLSTIPYKNSNVWTEFMHLIKSSLGLKIEDTAFAELLRLADKALK